MVLKTECRCIDSSLKSILDAAIHNLEKESIGTRTDDYERVKLDLEKHLEALKNMGIPDSQIETMRQSIPRDPIFKQFDDLKTWLNECECSETDVIDWTQFPYHEIGYRAPEGTPGSRATAFKSIVNQIESGLCDVSGVSTQEALGNAYKIEALSEKSIKALEQDTKVREHMNKKYPGGWAQASYKLELVKLGILTPHEYDNWNNMITEVKSSCGGKDFYNKWENDIYNIRKELKKKGIDIKIYPKPEQLKRK